MKLMDKYMSVDIFISCLQCRQTIPVVEQMFGLMLVAVVRYFAQLDHTAQQQQKEFLAVVGIILLQNLITHYKLPNLDPRSKSFAISS